MKHSYILTSLLAGLSVLSLLSCVQEADPEARAVLPSETSLSFEAVSAQPQTISVYADGLWKSDVSESWVTVSPSSGKGATEVTVTVQDNVTGSVVNLPRTATIIFRGGSIERQGTLDIVQAGDRYNGVPEYAVSGLAALEDATTVKVSTATVTAVGSTGFVITDGTAFAYVQGPAELKAGDAVTINGAKTTFNGVCSVILDEVTSVTEGEYSYPAPADLTSTIAQYSGTDIVYGTLSGSLVSGVLRVGPARVQLVGPAESLGIDAVDLHKVVLTGYAVGLAGSTGYFVVTKVEDNGVDDTLIPYPLWWAIGKDLNYSSSTFTKDSPRIDPVQGIGYLEYVPYDLEHTDDGGNYKLDVSGNNPRVTGPWVNDYWLFYGSGAVLAGTEVEIAFEMRSSAWGMKFWILEYLDGDEWFTAGTPQVTNEPGYETYYTVATNPDGSTNVPVMESIKFRKNNEHMQIRLRCSALWRGGGGTTASRSTASSRLSITNIEDDSYRPHIIITKEGDGVERDPVYADIQLSEKLLTFNGSNPAPKTFTVTSDHAFTVLPVAEWLSVDVTEGAAGEETVVTVTCESNEAADLRESSIKIFSEDSEASIPVVQGGAGQLLDPLISVSTGNYIDLTADAGSRKVTVQANVEVATESLADWLTVTAAGTRAQVEWLDYEVAFTANESTEPRTGQVRFFNTDKNLEAVVTFTQAGKIPEPDGVYFQDDFEWLETWSAPLNAPDDIATQTVATSKNVFTTADLAPMLEEFTKRGYGYVWGWKGQDWSDGTPDTGNKQTLYLMRNYLKFGKTSYNSGIILPALVKINGTDDVDLTFDWCWCMTGGKKPDIMTLTVTVTGGGVIAETGTAVSSEILSAQPTEGDQTVLEWQHAKVRILGATPETRITIRPTNTDPEVTSTRKQNRWYLDNIKVEKSVPVVHFQDDFEWLEPWSSALNAPDDIATQTVATSKNVFTTADLAPMLEEFTKRGYGYVWGWKGQDWSDGTPDTGNKQTLYLMRNYLKFGKTSCNSGIILPALSSIDGTSDVDLAFDWCWCMTGAKKPDIMTLTVTVSGGGVIAGTGTEVSPEITSSQPTEGDQTVLEWQHAKVRIIGATSSTRITIRPTNTDPEVTSTRKQNRWYLDNIVVSE